MTPVSDRNRDHFLYLSEISGCVRYTFAGSRQKVWNETENAITFAIENREHLSFSRQSGKRRKPKGKLRQIK
jgi:hypothetical protein